MCPVCQGRGQWNTEIDLVSFRCKRTACDRCHGAGWVETGSDPVGQMLFAVPMFVLYCFSILLAWLFGKKKKVAAEA